MATNTSDHGIPQNRKRWYCVGILKEAYPAGTEKRFEFPNAIPCSSMTRLLSASSPPSDAASGASDKSDHVQRNLDRAFKQIREYGLDPLNDSIAIDADADPNKLTWSSINLPCLTRSRYRGHWLSNLQRRTTLQEMMRFQGIKPGSFQQTCSDPEMGRLLGNSMSLNVVERILHKLFITVGILPKYKLDRWKCLSLSELLDLPTISCQNSNFQPRNSAERFELKIRTESSSDTANTDEMYWQSVEELEQIKRDRDKASSPPSEALHPFGSRSGGTRIVARIARCIIDSGASDHIISRKHLTKQELKSIRKADFVMTFQTANRTTQATEVVDYYVSDLDIYVTAWVLDDSPPLLSLGKLVEDFGLVYT